MSRIPGEALDTARTAARIRQLRKPFWLPVRGGSMAPGIRDGDLVFVRPLPENPTESIEDGDLVLFLKGDVPVVHRYAGREGGVYFERADRTGATAPMDPGEIIGKITALRRRGTVRTVRKPWGARLARWFKSITIWADNP